MLFFCFDVFVLSYWALKLLIPLLPLWKVIDALCCNTACWWSSNQSYLISETQQPSKELLGLFPPKFIIIIKNIKYKRGSNPPQKHYLISDTQQPSKELLGLFPPKFIMMLREGWASCNTFQVTSLSQYPQALLKSLKNLVKIGRKTSVLKSGKHIQTV